MELVLLGPLAFFILYFLMHAPTSDTAIGGVLNESLELILSLPNFFRDGGIIYSLAVFVSVQESG